MRKKVFVVDPEVYVCHIIAFTLTMEGYELETEVDIGNSFNRILDSRPDLVVIGLQGGEQLSVVAQIAEQRIPIIVLGSSHRIGRDAVLAHGGSDLFHKPFSPRRLVEKIAELLAN